MADTGWVFVGTGATDPAHGFVAWTNPGNITSSDDTDANSTTQGGQATEWLTGTDPAANGLSVTAGSTIDGIEMRVEVAPGAANISDDSARIVKGGTVSTTENVSTGPGGNWLTGDNLRTFGSATDLWGETWTVSDVTATDFGAVFAAVRDLGAPRSVFCDAMEIRVTYTAGAAGGDLEFAGNLAMMGAGR